MPGPLNGFKVIELAAWTFVPAAGAVLADWGADVIKVEHPETGDPQTRAYRLWDSAQRRRSELFDGTAQPRKEEHRHRRSRLRGASKS